MEDKAQTRPSVGKRWRFLIKALSSGQVEEAGARFPSFQLFTWWRNSKPDSAHGYEWYRVSCAFPAPPSASCFALKISLISGRKLTSEILSGFNNTGNVFVWPSEECLSIFALENANLFANKVVVELGAGMTGLAGLCLASNKNPPKRVTLTDGNHDSVTNLKRILEVNTELRCPVDAKVLRWDNEDSVDVADVVVCADCLFFDNGRPALINCLSRILREGGVAFIVAPERKGTFSHFVELLSESSLKFEVRDDYSERVTKAAKDLEDNEKFDRDEHFPKMIKIWKSVQK